MVCVDVIAASTQIFILHIQVRISVPVGFRCLLGAVLVLIHPLTPQFPHFLTNFPDETHSDIRVPGGPSVTHTRIGWGS